MTIYRFAVTAFYAQGLAVESSWAILPAATIRSAELLLGIRIYQAMIRGTAAIGILFTIATQISGFR